jgi:predicted RNase H-like HicB family nuclease
MASMSRLVYSVHIEPLPKGGFYITVPALPECWTTAPSFDSALRKAKNHIEKHLKMLVRADKPIPTEPQTVRPLCLPIRVNMPGGAKTVLASQLMRSA